MPRKPKEPHVPDGTYVTVKLSIDKDGHYKEEETVNDTGLTLEEWWARAIGTFKTLRRYEGQANVARIKKLLAVLRAEADAAYRAADSIERREKPSDGPRLRDRIDAAGLRGDEVAEETCTWANDPDVRAFFQGRQAALLGRDTSLGLRAYAHFLHKAIISQHETFLGLPELPDKGIKRKGRPQSVAMQALLDYADRMNVSDVTLARRLVSEGLEPEGPGSGDSLFEQWKSLIHSARRRRRQREGRKPKST